MVPHQTPSRGQKIESLRKFSCCQANGPVSADEDALTELRVIVGLCLVSKGQIDRAIAALEPLAGAWPEQSSALIIGDVGGFCLTEAEPCLRECFMPVLHVPCWCKTQHRVIFKYSVTTALTVASVDTLGTVNGL